MRCTRFSIDRSSGRLSVRVDAEPVRAVTAAFELQGDAHQGVMVLTSPLGATMAEARWSPAATVLTVPGAQSRYADLDDLAAQALGERLPMAALFDWLRGRPWAGAVARPLANAAPGFEQLGWQVRLERFDEGLVGRWPFSALMTCLHLDRIGVADTGRDPLRKRHIVGISVVRGSDQSGRIVDQSLGQIS